MGLFALAAGLALSAAPAAAQPAPAPCATPEHRAFDFWVGRWDVYPTGAGRLVAHSLVERLYGGCAIRENWMPLKGAGGGSLSSYVPRTKGWEQSWVDSSGATVHFSGGRRGEAMVLTGWWTDVLGPGKGALVRMTYSRSSGGAVRQRGETSVDAGRSWQPSFDFTYRPARP